MPAPRPLLSDAELDEIERLARLNESETYRGPLLALVDEVRRLRVISFGPSVVARQLK